MEVKNYNDIIRDFIFNKLRFAKETKDENKYNLIINELYNKFKDNKYFISVLYLTAYITNYFAYKMYPEDEQIKNDINFLSNILSIDELMCILDTNIFKSLCADTFLFSSSDYYFKKKTVTNPNLSFNKISNVSPSFILDLIKYNTKYTANIIVDKYYQMLKIEGNHKIAIEDTICFGIDFLVELQENDIDNYKEFMNSILSDYYIYNKYLLLAGKEVDEYTLFIMNEIEKNVNNLIVFSYNNAELLETIIRDYLSYMLLEDIEKKEIKESSKIKLSDNNNFNIISNPNTIIRKTLCDIFKEIPSIDEQSLDKYKDELEKLKESSIFDEIVKVLYVDDMITCSFEYLTFPNDELAKENYDYISQMKSIEEYENSLLEDDFGLLYAIGNSTDFYNTSLIDKKDMLKTLHNYKIFDSFIIKNYLFDLIEFGRKYSVDDASLIYYKLYDLENDKKIAVAKSTYELECDLLDLQLVDENNYDEVVYDISKIFYEYNKYLLDNGVKIEKTNKKIISMMEKNIDDFFSKLYQDGKLLESIIKSFYEYISCDELKKQIVLSNYEKQIKSGKVKIFNKKNKNSN